MDAHFFDSHAHLTCPDLWSEVGAIVARAEKAKVKKIVTIATEEFSLKKGLELQKKYPWIYVAGATTPHDVERLGEQEFGLFEKVAREKKLIAIGETGLDYFYEHSPKKLQQEFMLRYLNLAKETVLPVIFHCREAFKDLFSLTQGFSGPVLLHCFTGSWEEAKIALDRNWKISFSGIITFKKSTALKEVAKKIPLDSMLIETDAPYLAPLSRRGKMNEPSFIVETAKVLAELKNLELIEVAQITYENALNFFQLT